LVIAYGTLVIFYAIEWRNITTYESEEISRNTTVSIVVAARNESANIVKCLDSLLNQSYPSFLYEVILIDDHSEDNTFSLANSMGAKNLRVFHLSELIGNEGNINSFKKKAIEKGIDQSKAELIVTTDADCFVNEKWLRTIVSFYEREACQLIAAPVMFYEDESFIKKFQSFDFCGMMVTTGALINSKKGNMCNGANMAYNRNAFHLVKGFADIDQYGSGDDVFLMHKIQQKYDDGCKFLKSKQATVLTLAQPTVKSFFNQRIRWASKNKHFKDRSINIQLALILTANVSIVLNLSAVIFCGLLNCLNPFLFWILIFQLVAKSIADFVYLSTGTSFFKRNDLLWLFLPAQFLHIVYISTVGIWGNISNYQWKGRNYEK